MTDRTIFTATAAAALALSLAGAAAAQDAPDYSAETLDMFAATLIDVTELRDSWAARLEAAGSAEEQEALVARANAEIVEAIRAGGMAVEDYQAILTVAAEDEALADRILGRVEAIRDADG